MFVRCTQYTFSIVNKNKRLFPREYRAPTPKTPEVLPAQYPKNLTDNNPSVIHRGRPIKHSSPRYQVLPQKDIPMNYLVMSSDENPYRKVMKTLNIQSKVKPTKLQQLNMYSLKVGILGPVNCGKSSLVNSLGHKVSAVSPKAHTTFQNIDSIKTYQVDHELGKRDVQIHLIDTPGILSTGNKRDAINNAGWEIVPQIDLALLVVDATKRCEHALRKGVERLEAKSHDTGFIKSLVLNKVDLVDSQRRFRGLISELEKYGKFDQIFYVSTLTGYGLKDLEKYLIGMAKPREWEHPKHAKTLLTERELYEEWMKEALYSRTYEEIPHQTSLECDAVSRLTDGNQFIKFRLRVLTDNQRRALIGIEGMNIEVMKRMFKKIYVTEKKEEKEPQVEIQVSLMSKAEAQIERSQETVSHEKSAELDAIKQLEKSKEELEKKLAELFK